MKKFRYILLPEGAEIVGYAGTVMADNAVKALKQFKKQGANLRPSMMLWQVALEGQEYRFAADIIMDIKK